MKRITALLLLAAMLFALAACGRQTADAATQTDNALANALPGVLPTETVSSLVYSNGSVTTRFVWREDKWVWQDEETFPLDGTYVQQIIDILLSMGENPPLGVTSDLGAYGLTDAVHYITVSDETGSLTMYIGTSAPEGGRYMALEGDTSGSVYLASQELLDALERPIYDMALLPALPEIPADGAVSLHLSQGDASYYAHKVSGVWRADGRDVAGGFEELWDSVATWQISRCVDFKPSQGVYELCGLDEPLRMELTYINSVGTESVFTMSVGDAGGEEEQSEYYVLVGEDTTVYSMSGQLLTELLAAARRSLR